MNYGRKFAVILLALMVMCVGASILMVRLAHAHAEVAESNPADGSAVPVGLREITLTFTEDVSIAQSSVEAIGPTGKLLEGTSSAVDRANRRLLRVTTPALAKGQYTVEWRVVTEDDNAISNGQISFSVTNEVPAGTTLDLLPVLLLAAAVLLAVTLYLVAKRRNTKSAR